MFNYKFKIIVFEEVIITYWLFLHFQNLVKEIIIGYLFRSIEILMKSLNLLLKYSQNSNNSLVNLKNEIIQIISIIIIC